MNYFKAKKKFNKRTQNSEKFDLFDHRVDQRFQHLLLETTKFKFCPNDSVLILKPIVKEFSYTVENKSKKEIVHLSVHNPKRTC